jgi:hypothetical protein
MQRGSLILGDDPLWPVHEVLHLARSESEQHPRRIGELASEGCACEFLRDARQMVLGIGTLKAEGQHKTRTLGVSGAPRTFAVSKITDDHVASRTDRESRSLERRVLQVHVHHLFGPRRCFTLLVDVHIHRQRLTVAPLPCAALSCSHPGLDGR